MLKIFAIVAVYIATAQGFKFWFSDNNQKSEAMADKLNQWYVNDEDVQKGSSITPSVQSEIKGHIQTAAIYFGNDYWKNVNWIQSKLNQNYPGDWLVVMLNSTATTQVIPNVTFGVSTFSLNGSWWIYWRGANHYQTSFAYYISRQGANTQNLTTPFCHSLNNMSYYYTDTFKNIVSAVESDVSPLMSQAVQIQTFLKQYNPNLPANVFISSKLSFFGCQWGVKDSNYITPSPVKQNTVLSFPRV